MPIAGSWLRGLACLALLSIATLGCGSEAGAPGPKLKPQATGDGNAPANTTTFDASMHTPGYFRNTFRMLEAQVLIDDQTAVGRMLLELPVRIRQPGELPSMLEIDLATIEGLLAMALRSVQGTQAAVAVSRKIGEGMLTSTLMLDPARQAWNRTHDQAEQVEVESGGPVVLAKSGLAAAELVGASQLCIRPAASSSGWDPGESEVVWVDERCQPDRMVGGYCEPDRWIEGECFDEWIPEQCSGGRWEDRGYYDYRCYSNDDCRYEWVSRYEYVEGNCTGGYYQEDCYPGRWEYGLCYEGTFVPGYCIPGHTEYRFPGGTWTFEEHMTAPPECSPVRPSQLAVAAATVRALKDKVYAAMDPEWQAAVDQLLLSGRLDTANEPGLDAALQILEAVAEGE